jgi:hypothetical protein
VTSDSPPSPWYLEVSITGVQGLRGLLVSTKLRFRECNPPFKIHPHSVTLLYLFYWYCFFFSVSTPCRVLRTMTIGLQPLSYQKIANVVKHSTNPMSSFDITLPPVTYTRGEEGFKLVVAVRKSVARLIIHIFWCFFCCRCSSPVHTKQETAKARQ